MKYLEEKISKVLKNFEVKDAEEVGYVAAVGIVFNSKGEVLLGTATSDDNRFGKLCFPGGGSEKDETVHETAEREVREETGLNVKSRGKIFIHPSKSEVAFIACDLIDGEINHNNEFTNMGWYPVREAIENPNLFSQNREILETNFLKNDINNRKH